MSDRDMKKIIIIGASSGIGREIARLYAQDGFRVGVTGRRAELLEELRSEFPDRVVTASFDVRDMDNHARLDGLMAELGGMDICLISAGIGTVSKQLDWQIERQTFETNVSGFTEAATWAFNHFIRQGHGQLANISSVASLRGNSHAPAYSATKAYQSVYFEGLRMKAMYLKTPVHITDILPGFVKTKMAQGDKIFWQAPVEKAAQQIKAGIDTKRSRFYVTRRWALVGWLMRRLPDFIYHRLG
jgi:short-subunit dehydrogenase